MKKIFTLLLLAVGMISVAQAQPGSRDRQNDQRNDQRDERRDNDFDKGNDIVIDRNVMYDGDSRYDNRFMSIEKQRDLEIAQINREYDHKIQKVKRSYFGSRFSKERQIRMLEQQRQQEIRDVYIKYMHMKKNGKNRRY